MSPIDKVFFKALVIGILFFIGFFCAYLKAHASDYRPRGSANAQAHARKGQLLQKYNPEHTVKRKKR